ncbi:MAG: HAD-IG family 5'-nucleotidase [Nannocystaceae bacterium]|nr:HAD-IG family 5'-nucleotidase [Nannocystaceae bacterium]
MADVDLPSPIRGILLDAGLETEAPPERRIFTNRDLNLERIGLIGFDMDYTLAIYRQDALERVSIEATVDKLIGRGYPEALRTAEHDPRFAIRGLTVDKQLGNVIKMDRHGYVGRAYHGRRVLASEERRAVYREQRLGHEHERFAPVDTLFALPEVTLYAVVVDMLDEHPELFSARDKPSYAEVYQDVRECIDASHQDGSIKDLIKANPERYIERDPDLPKTLHKFRSAGKRLFLLTNSYFPYSDAVMSYLLGGEPSYPDWTAYFDWIVVGSKKPGFFTRSEPFQELDRSGKRIGAPRQDVQRGKLYEGGNHSALQASFDAYGDEVLYIGDHIYGDIVRSKKSSGWRTALVVQELHQEIAVRRARGMTLREISSLHRLRSEIAEKISVQRHLMRALGRIEPGDVAASGDMDVAEATEMLDATKVRIKGRFDRLRRYEQETTDTLERRSQEVDEAFNPYWGSSFAERHDTSRFGSQVEAFACIYTSRVSNLQFISPSRYFMSPHGSLPHWL